MTQIRAGADGAQASAERGAALRVIARHVRARFALDLETFAERALEVARSAFPGGALADSLAGLSLDDLYLATACARGDERAWDECAARFFGFMRDFARRRLRGPQADEVADQVIADLWQRGKMARFEGRSALRTWLGAVVAHAVVNAAKAERPTLSLESEAAQREARRQIAPRGEAQEIEARAAALVARFLTQAMAEMDGDDKLLLLLYYEQGLTLDQIAVVRRTSKSSLSRRLTRLRTLLRARVEELARGAGASLDELRAGLDLSRVELDLGRLLRGPQRMGEEPERLV